MHVLIVGKLVFTSSYKTKSLWDVCIAKPSRTSCALEILSRWAWSKTSDFKSPVVMVDRIAVHVFCTLKKTLSLSERSTRVSGQDLHQHEDISIDKMETLFKSCSCRRVISIIYSCQFLLPQFVFAADHRRRIKKDCISFYNRNNFNPRRSTNMVQQQFGKKTYCLGLMLTKPIADVLNDCAQTSLLCIVVLDLLT